MNTRPETAPRDPSGTPPLSPLTVNVFPAGFVLPLWAAQAKGLFAANGLQVELIPTPNSVAQMTGLLDGAFDIAMTAVDNVIAYVNGQGEAQTAAPPDIVAVMGSSNGFLSLMAASEVHGVTDFRGRTLAVDAMTTGYSFTLRRMLETAGLAPGDYTLVPVGGMKERYQDLMRGGCAGTLLVPPFTVMAQAKGFREVATPVSLFSHFQGGVAAVRRDRAASRGDDVTGFIRANLAALAWLYDPANREEVLDLFQARMAGVPRAVAERSCAVLLHPVTGFTHDAIIDMEGVRTVIAVRAAFAEPRRALGNPERYCDLSFHRRALVAP